MIGSNGWLLIVPAANVSGIGEESEMGKSAEKHQNLKPQASGKQQAPNPKQKVALSLNLDGPPDWSEKFEDYLDGDLGEARR